jgi:hypothetical protein
LEITTVTLGDAYVGVYYSVQLKTNRQAEEDVVDWTTWSIVEGGLPPSLELVERTGYIVGIPQSAGDYAFKVEAVYHEVDFGPSDIAEREFTLKVKEAPPQPPPSQPMEFSCSAYPNTIYLDPTDIASGKSPMVSATFTLTLKKTGGDLTEYVSISAASSVPQIRVFPTETGATPRFTKLFSVMIFADSWQELQPMASYVVSIVCKTSGKSQTLVEWVIIERASLPDLILKDVSAVTQHGYDLIRNKPTQFFFKYAQPYAFGGSYSTSNVTVWVELRLPKSQWYFNWDRVTLPLDPFTFRFREENDYYVFDRQFELPPVAVSSHSEVEFLPKEKGFFYPEPTSNVATYELKLDAPNGVMEADETNNQIVKTQGVPYQASKMDLAWKMFDWTGHKFSEQEYWKAVDYWFSSQPPAPERYLPAIFPIKQLNVHPLDPYIQWYPKVEWYRRQLGKYTATDLDKTCDEIISGNDFTSEAALMAEEAQEANYDRVVVITPNNFLGDRMCDPGVIGVVWPNSWWYGDSGMVAFVELDSATGNMNGQPYMPVVAHELSHTFGFPDIYGNPACSKTPTVDYPWIYFDPVAGGIPKYASSATDIMACSGSALDSYWSSHSYDSVHNGLKGFGDPPVGLLISMILYRNGTVVASPFEKLLDHTYPVPKTEASGNFHVVLLAKDGTILRNYPMNVTFSVFIDPGGQKSVDAVPIVGMVEYPDNLAAIELRDGSGQVLIRRVVSAHTPELKVTWPTPGTQLGRGQNYTVEWEAIDADGGQLWYSVLMRQKGEEVWSSLAHFATGTSLKFDVAKGAKLGDYELEVMVTDGVNTDIQIVPFSILESTGPSQSTTRTTGSQTPATYPSTLPFDTSYMIFGIVAVMAVVLIAVYARTRKRSPPRPVVTTTAAFCVNCGRQLQPNDKFCRKCGNKLKRG